MSTTRRLSVRDFGAIGDGVHDDTVAIQATIDHINATGSKEDLSCFFPPGTFLVTSAITIPTGLYLEGAGDDSKIQIAKNDPSGTVTAFNVAASATVSMSEIKFVKPSSDDNAATYRAILHEGTAGQMILSKVSADTDVQIEIPANVDIVQNSLGDIETPAARATLTHDADRELWIGGNQPFIIKGTSDPSAGDGVVAPEGSIYLRYVSGAGTTWYKSTASNTGWTLIGSGANTGVSLTPTVVAAATYTTLAADELLSVTYTATGAVTITLIAAATAGAGATLYVVDTGGTALTNNITIDGNASETISGATTFVIEGNYNGVTLWCDGSNWFVI